MTYAYTKGDEQNALLFFQRLLQDAKLPEEKDKIEKMVSDIHIQLEKKGERPKYEVLMPQNQAGGETFIDNTMRV